MTSNFNPSDETYETLQDIAFNKVFYGEDGLTTKLDDEELFEIISAILTDDEKTFPTYLNYDYLFKDGTFAGINILRDLFLNPEEQTDEKFERLGKLIYDTAYDNLRELAEFEYVTYLENSGYRIFED